MSSPLDSYIARKYVDAKRCYPGEGRRRWRLRVPQQFWDAPPSNPPRPQDASPEVTSTAESDRDPDPLDAITTRDIPGLGLIVHTDFSDEPSWLVFCSHVQEGEKELVSRGEGVPDEQDDSASSDSGDEGIPPAIFRIVNPSSQREREILENASNLTVLRLLNDVGIRSSPTLPQGAKCISPPNRLVDKRGWQEFYRGKNVWIYDTKSNVDRSVRVVSQSGDMYGTATGDSWRAQVSHICEIRLNLSLGAIRIDFGGLDRWDFVERSRNMMEAEVQPYF